MKYKVGDKVKIKSLDWYNDNRDYDGNVECGFYYFTEEMSKYCGKILTIGNIHKNGYDLQEDENFAWTDDMFDSIIENPDDVESKASSDSDKMVSLKMICEYLDKELYTSYDLLGNIQTVSKNAVSKEDFINKLCKEIELCLKN